MPTPEITAALQAADDAIGRLDETLAGLSEGGGPAPGAPRRGVDGGSARLAHQHVGAAVDRGPDPGGERFPPGPLGRS